MEVGLAVAIVFAAAGAMIMWSMYQRLSFQRKKLNDLDATDTPGIDRKYTLTGCMVVCGWVYSGFYNAPSLIGGTSMGSSMSAVFENSKFADFQRQSGFTVFAGMI